MTAILPARASDPPVLTGLLGILGGMGPLATAHFYRRLVELTPGERDQDHIPVVIWGDPTVPDRTAALTGQGAASPLPWLLRGAAALKSLGADLIVIPCNTAHPYLPALRKSVRVPVLDMVQATAIAAATKTGTGGRVAVLSTEGTHQTGLYQRYLRAQGVDAVALTWRARRRVQSAIDAIKAGQPITGARLIDEVLGELRWLRPDLVIAGCTELTTLTDQLAEHFLIVDSTSELASAAIAALRPPHPN